MSDRIRIPRILIFAAASLLVWGSAARGAFPGVAAKLDPRLAAAATFAPADTVPVWLSFVDKGETDPEDLALRLSRARLELSPRALARRLRIGLQPLVDYADLPIHGPYLEALSARALVPFATSRWFNQVAVRMPAALLAEIAALPFVSRLSPVERARRTRDLPASGAANTPGATNVLCATCAATTHSFDYGLNTGPVTQLDVPAVHDSGYIGTGVLVAILDDGFNYHNKHEALSPVSVPQGFERDFVDGDWSAQDTLRFRCCDHGTYVMGCIAGNRPGKYVGTAPGAQFALARTEVDTSETTIEMVYWGMAAEWADSLGADEITTSLGYSQFDNGIGDYTFNDMNGHTTTVSRAAEIAASKGILVVAAAGNEGDTAWQRITAPADVNGDSLIAVGAVNLSGARAVFSSTGPTVDGRIKPDLMAMGSFNQLTAPNGSPQGYAVASGTSFSTPLLAGLAACLIQARPSFTPTMIIRALRETASRATSPDNLVGYGIPDGLAALRWGSATLSALPEPPVALGLRLLGPNPRSPCDNPSVVRYALGAGAPPSARARLSVLDAQGRHVRSLFEGALSRGQWQQVAWDGRDEQGRASPSGLYFVVLDAAGRRTAARLVSLR